MAAMISSSIWRNLLRYSLGPSSVLRMNRWLGRASMAIVGILLFLLFDSDGQPDLRCEPILGTQIPTHHQASYSSGPKQNRQNYMLRGKLFSEIKPSLPFVHHVFDLVNSPVSFIASAALKNAGDAMLNASPAFFSAAPVLNDASPAISIAGVYQKSPAICIASPAVLIAGV